MQCALAVATLKLWTCGRLLLASTESGVLVLCYAVLVSHEAVRLSVTSPGPLDAEVVGALELVWAAEHSRGLGAVLLVAVLLVHAVVMTIAVPGHVNTVTIGTLELVRVAPEHDTRIL